LKTKPSRGLTWRVLQAFGQNKKAF
jgi:hypothetical protein